MVTLPPWLVGLTVVYVIALTFFFGYIFVEQAGQKRRTARQKAAADHDAEIIAVAEQGLEERPELADDAEAVARTVLALNEAIRAEAARDAAGAAFVTPGHARLDGFLAELFPRTKDAPKEKP